MKKTTNKPSDSGKKPSTLTELKTPLRRKMKALEAATEVMLFMLIERESMSVQVAREPYYYVSSYTPTNNKKLIVATISMVAAPWMYHNGRVQWETIYKELLELPDPKCLMDKLSEEDVLKLLSTTLHLMQTNWCVVESIATTLLGYKNHEAKATTVSFSPADYFITS